MTVVFDFGGVLFRWRPRELLARVLPQRAAIAAAAEHWFDAIFQGYGGEWGEFDRGTISAGDLVERIAARTGLAPHEVQAVVDAVPEELSPVPDSVELLRQLHAARRRLYFLSNMPEPFACHLEQTQPLLGLFHGGLFSARVGLVKPEPAIFELARQRFGLEPADTLFIDDHAGNVQAARAAGWQGLHFVDPAQCAAALRAAGLL